MRTCEQGTHACRFLNTGKDATFMIEDLLGFN
jgi:hypothetical protein